jgi:hypothetical protein
MLNETMAGQQAGGMQQIVTGAIGTKTSDTFDPSKESTIAPMANRWRRGCRG